MKLQDILTPELFTVAMLLNPQDFITFSKTISQIVQDAREMMRVVQEQFTQFAEYGVTKEQVDEALTLIQALDQAQADREGASRLRSVDSEAYKLAQKEGAVMIDDMLAAFRLSFRKRPELLEQVVDIAKGSTIDDFIHDFTRVATLAEENLELVSVAKITEENIQACLKMRDRIANLSTKTKYDSQFMNEKVEMRNRILTIAQEPLYEIRDLGKFVFRNDEKLLPFFNFSY